MEKEKNVEVVAPATEIWDNSGRAKSLITAFSILAAFLIVVIFLDYLEIERLMKIKSGATNEESLAEDLIKLAVALSQSGLYIWSIVVFLKWFRRAYGNLHRLGIEDIKHPESMAVWYWVIPILSWYRPVQIMNEIWRKTQDKIKQYDSFYSSIDYSWVIGIWWILYIVSNFIGRYLMKTMFKTETINEMLNSAEATIIVDSIHIIEALLVILIVSKMSKIEQKLAESVSVAGGSIVYKK